MVFTSTRERRLWLWALAAVAAIYATLGQAPSLAAALRDRGALDSLFLMIFLVVVAAMASVGIVQRWGGREVAVGIAVVGTYVAALLRFANPAERTHLFEFGVVAVLIHLALAERRRNGARIRAPAAWAFGATVILGWIDEAIQAVLPNRIYDIRDVGFNALAALLAVLALTALQWARTRRAHRDDP